MRDFRESWGLPPKTVALCPHCHTEHKGRCHYLRSKRHRKARVEEVERWLATRHERKMKLLVQKLIRELSDAVETGRRTARPTGWLGRKPGPKGRLAMATNPRQTKRNTLARKRTKQDGRK